MLRVQKSDIVMIKVAQGNMRRSRTAHQLLYQIQREVNADLWLISEQYPTQNSNPRTWFDDELGTAAIWISNPGGFPVEESGRGRGFVWIRSKSITYVSCYLTLNGPVQNYYGKLNDLEDFAREVGNNLIIAGDFNAKAVDWGMH